MWYVRFGGEQFGPFDKPELDEFIDQLGAAEDVEVRKADETTWAPVERNMLSTHELDVQVGGDEDKTLMSTNMSSEMMAEFRALLDQHSDDEDFEARPAPPKTRIDVIPDAVIQPKLIDLGETSASIDQMMTESSDSKDLLKEVPDIGLGASRDSMLISAPQAEDAHELDNPSITNVGDVPVATSLMEPFEPQTLVPATKAPSAGPPELPNVLETRHDAAFIPPLNLDFQTQSTPPKKSILLPPAIEPELREGANQSGGVSSATRSRPSSPFNSEQPTFTMESSSPSRTLKIALALTVGLGGLGAAMIWVKKRPAELKQDVVHVSDPTDTPKFDTDASSNLVVINSEQSPAINAESDTHGKLAAQNQEKLPIESKNLNAATDVSSPSREREASKPEAETVVKKKHASASTKTTASKVKGKKPLKGRWVRKKKTAVLPRLNRVAIEGVMKSQRAKLKACASGSMPKVTASLEILSSGVVRKSQIFDRGALKTSVKVCLERALRELNFPKTKTPVDQVRIPIEL